MGDFLTVGSFVNVSAGEIWRLTEQVVMESPLLIHAHGKRRTLRQIHPVYQCQTIALESIACVLLLAATKRTVCFFNALTVDVFGRFE